MSLDDIPEFVFLSGQEKTGTSWPDRLPDRRFRGLFILFERGEKTYMVAGDFSSHRGHAGICKRYLALVSCVYDVPIETVIAEFGKPTGGGDICTTPYTITLSEISGDFGAYNSVKAEPILKRLRDAEFPSKNIFLE